MVNSNFDSIRCKNEESFYFEKFIVKLQKAYGELEDNGSTVHNEDIVDVV